MRAVMNAGEEPTCAILAFHLAYVQAEILHQSRTYKRFKHLAVDHSQSLFDLKFYLVALCATSSCHTT